LAKFINHKIALILDLEGYNGSWQKLKYDQALIFFSHLHLNLYYKHHYIFSNSFFFDHEHSRIREKMRRKNIWILEKSQLKKL
jgi:hypothetical protein